MQHPLYFLDSAGWCPYCGAQHWERARLKRHILGARACRSAWQASPCTTADPVRLAYLTTLERTQVAAHR
eukprot:840931-Prorocentrum_lima.AAC.1